MSRQAKARYYENKLGTYVHRKDIYLQSVQVRGTGLNFLEN